MFERQKPHNGRSQDDHFQARKVNLDDLATDSDEMAYIDDIRFGGAAADIGPDAVRLATRLQNLIDNNRIDVDHLLGRSSQVRGHAPHGNRVQRRHRGR